MIEKSKYYNPDRGADQRMALPVQPKNSFVVSKIWDRHKEMIRLIHLGAKNVEIAEKLGCTPQSVSQVRNSPIVQQQLSIMQAARDADTIDLSKEIMRIAPTALKNLEQALSAQGRFENITAGQQISVSQDILDRAGHGKVIKNQNLNANVFFTPEEIESLKERGREFLRSRNHMVNVTPQKGQQQDELTKNNTRS